MVDKDKAYTVVLVDNQYQVQSVNGRVVMTLRDQASAQHYAVSLCDAYSAGFKQGYKQARSGPGGDNPV